MKKCVRNLHIYCRGCEIYCKFPRKKSNQCSCMIELQDKLNQSVTFEIVLFVNERKLSRYLNYSRFVLFLSFLGNLGPHRWMRSSHVSYHASHHTLHCSADDERPCSSQPQRVLAETTRTPRFHQLSRKIHYSN